jgi:hypothetical protein
MGSIAGLALIDVSSVVVDDLDMVRSGGAPTEADAPLIVHSDAVLAGTVAGQSFEPVARWDSQVAEGLGGVKYQQLAQRRSLDGRIQTSRPFAAPDPFRVLVGERVEHTLV